jgi:hypothetical protein
MNTGERRWTTQFLIICVHLCSSVACISAFAAEPTTAPKTPEGAFEVTDWVIFICDPNQPQANASTLFQSTLPDFTGSRRSPAPVEKESDPAPIGVIRFRGSAGDKETLDVLLQNKGGRFLATWPKAQTRTGGVLWQNFTLSDKPPVSQEQIGGSSWMNALRNAAGSPPFIMKESRGERFLVYDAEPNYKLPLKVAAGSAPDQYVISNSDPKLPLRDLTFYKNEPDGWHTVTLVELAPTPTTKPATKPATTTASTAPLPTTVAVAATRPATTRSATQASSQPATQPTGQPIALHAAGTKDAAQILAPWKQKLTAGGLPATDHDLILKILELHALDPHRLTAVYRLDIDQMEQILPLEVTPQPRRTNRVGLVIVRNIDPAILTEIENLVTQLGDPRWDNREAASKRLRDLGLAAKPKLEAMLKTSKDPEITFRIERLIAALTHNPQPVEQPQPSP